MHSRSTSGGVVDLDGLDDVLEHLLHGGVLGVAHDDVAVALIGVALGGADVGDAGLADELAVALVDLLEAGGAGWGVGRGFACASMG